MSDRTTLPVIVERSARGEYALDPYSKLFADRIVFLAAPIDDTLAADIASQLLYLDHLAPERDISLYLTSPGGSPNATLAILDTIRSLTSDVSTVCLGQAGPATALLLAAGTRGKRLALPNCRITIRQLRQEPRQGPTDDMSREAGELLRIADLVEEILTGCTGQPRARIHRDLDRGADLTGPEAITYGLVDALVARRPRPDRD